MVESKMPESPLASIYREIEQALAANLYYLAIAVTVSIPDICATLEGKAPTDWNTYKTWFRENAGDRFTNFGEDECYELRCGVVHNAKLMGGKVKRSKYDRIILTPPNSLALIHDGVMSNIGGLTETVLCMDVTMLCEAMIAAARAWERANERNETVSNNMANVVRLRPEGLDPYIVGIGVIS